jgi:hypothetical protein
MFKISTEIVFFYLKKNIILFLPENFAMPPIKSKFSNAKQALANFRFISILYDLNVGNMFDLCL